MPNAKPDLHIVDNNDPLNNIPEELRKLDSWIVWKYFTKPDGEITKPPFDYRTGRIAKNGIHTEKAYMPFDEAKEVLASGKHNFDGIGLVLREGYGLVGYDADHCIDADGKIDPVVQSDIDALNSYTEISPSGEGIRIFVYGKKPGSKENNGEGFEMYDETSTRYLTLTGNMIGEATAVNTPSQSVIVAIYTRVFAKDLSPATDAVSAATEGFPEGTGGLSPSINIWRNFETGKPRLSWKGCLVMRDSLNSGGSEMAKMTLNATMA